MSAHTGALWLSNTIGSEDGEEDEPNNITDSLSPASLPLMGYTCSGHARY